MKWNQLHLQPTESWSLLMPLSHLFYQLKLVADIGEPTQPIWLCALMAQDETAVRHKPQCILADGEG